MPVKKCEMSDLLAVRKPRDSDLDGYGRSVNGQRDTMLHAVHIFTSAAGSVILLSFKLTGPVYSVHRDRTERTRRKNTVFFPW